MRAYAEILQHQRWETWLQLLRVRYPQTLQCVYTCIPLCVCGLRCRRCSQSTRAIRIWHASVVDGSIWQRNNLCGIVGWQCRAPDWIADRKHMCLAQAWPGAPRQSISSMSMVARRWHHSNFSATLLVKYLHSSGTMRHRGRAFTPQCRLTATQGIV